MRCKPLLFVPFLVCGCASLEKSADASAAPGSKSAPQQPTAQGPEGGPAAPAKPGAIERTGVLAPVDPAVLTLWPATWSGEMLVLEVAEHGSSVKQGDVVLTFERRGFDQKLTSAERDLHSSEIRHAGLLERNRLDEQSAASALEQTKAKLDRARRALDGYLGREIPFSKRQDELMALREKSNIEDQQDELAQVEKMYSADELVDDTEEIVLKRSRRDLATTIDSVKLSRDRRQYEDELPEALQIESRKEDVSVQELALERLQKSQEIERIARQDAEARSTAELAEQRSELERLRGDAQLFTLKAPRDGVLLHGKLDDYRPGSAAGRLERGSRVALRSDVLMVADPAHMAVAIDLPESQRAALHPGGSAIVRPLSLPGTELSGKVALDAWPEPKPGDEGQFAGTVVLQDPLPEGLQFGLRAKVELGSTAQPEG
jgi:multidrug resistance efflux pump